MIKQCQICNQDFETLPTGGSRKYCFNCSPPYAKNPANYLKLSMKKEMIKRMGGKCSKCGYNKSIAALQFHHTDPLIKEFALMESTHSWDKFQKEAEKCELLCANCHIEFHSKEDA